MMWPWFKPRREPLFGPRRDPFEDMVDLWKQSDARHDETKAILGQAVDLLERAYREIPGEPTVKRDIKRFLQHFMSPTGNRGDDLDR